MTLKILVVEDELLAQMMIRLMLEQLGYAVDVAGDHKTAINLFKNNSYNLIFMDIGLGDSDGYAVTREMRQLEQENHKKFTPIVALTAYLDEDRKQACLASGMNDAFTKPLTQEMLPPLLAYIA